MVREVVIRIETHQDRFHDLPLDPLAPAVTVVDPGGLPPHLDEHTRRLLYCGAFNPEDVELVTQFFHRNRDKFMNVKVETDRDLMRMRFRLVLILHIADLTEEERRRNVQMGRSVATAPNVGLTGGRRMRLRSSEG